MLSDMQRRAVVSAITRYDQRLERAAIRAGRPVNIYALGIMLGGVDRACKHKGTPRESLRACFNDRLLDVCLKAIGEAPGTREEIRGDYNRSPF